MPRLPNRRRRHSLIAEALETRCLMAGLSTAKSPIDSKLIDLIEPGAVRFGQGPVNTSAVIAEAKASYVQYTSSGDVGVEITAIDTNALAPKLAALGVSVTAQSAEHHLISGYSPVTVLDSLLTLRSAGLLGVQPMYTPLLNAGSVDDQADVIHESERVRTSSPVGYDGTGIKIGVMSDSYNSLGGAAADIASGDLPATVQVIQDSGTTDEGRAMLQLVHDVAPGASLAFATANGGQQTFADNIQNLANAGCSVIVDDVSYFAEPMFQDGIIAQAVDNVVANNNVTYFSSAANSADHSYESTSVNMVPDSLGFKPFGDSPDAFYDFDPGAGVDTRQSITLGDNKKILLSFQWDDPFYTASGVDTDLDIFLVKAGTNTIVASSAADNLADQTPSEVFSFTNSVATTGTTAFELIINKYAGPDPGRVKYVDFRAQGTVNEYATNSSTVYGHAAAASAVSVAASRYHLQDSTESFSSRGPTTILFTAAGVPQSPVVRNTPVVSAIDGTDTTFFGSDYEGNGHPNFFGTSAAAPHAAAVAALVRQANPAFTPTQVYQRLKDTAIDLGTPGWDNSSGFGLVNAYDAIFGSAQAVGPNFTEGFENGGLSTAWETNTKVNGRIRVTTSGSPASGSAHLNLDDFFTYTGPSVKEAVLHVNLRHYTNASLTFKEMETSDSDDAMPATFVGSSNSDGVALSVDGVNWIRLISLTGSNSTVSYQTNTIDLSAAAAAAGIVLGSDVRIKFQEYGASTGGMFFDDVGLTAAPSNSPPTATSDTLTTSEDTAAGGTLAGSDGDSDTLTFAIATGPSHGAISDFNAATGAYTYTPTGDYNGPDSFTFTVNDGTVDSAPATINITVSPVNDPPTLTGAARPSFGSMLEDASAANIAGVLVSSLVAGNASDIDGDTLGIAVVAIGNPGKGTYQYMLSGASWTSITPVSDSNALLLPADALVRFVPKANANGTINLYFRAWDGSHGTAGGSLNLPLEPIGTRPISTTFAIAQATVTPVNDAPALIVTGTPSFGNITEDDADPPGVLVSSLVANRPTDVDGETAGVAIVGLGNPAKGQYQFQLAGGAWTTIASASDAGATLLPADARVRFLPNKDFNGSVSLYYRAWDGSQGTAGGTLNLAGSIGGAGCVSSVFVKATCNVAAVNDAPVLQPGLSSPTAYTHGTPPILLMGAATTVTDVDSLNFNGGQLKVAGVAAGDVVTLSGRFSLSGVQVLYTPDGQAPLVLGTRNTEGGNGSDLTIDFTSAAATQDLVQRLVRSLRFGSAGAAGSRSLAVSLSDDTQTLSNVVSRVINVQ
jgi:hypothetical protein